MEDKIEKLRTFAEKADYSHKIINDGRLRKSRSEICGIFDEIYTITQDETIKLNCLLGEISFWIWATHKNTGHNYDCIMEQVTKAIKPIHQAMEKGDVPINLKKHLEDKLKTLKKVKED